MSMTTVPARAAAASAGQPTVDVGERRKLAARRRDSLIGFLSPLLLLALWEVLVHGGVVDKRFFPAPSSIIAAAYDLAITGKLHDHVLKSLWRLAQGFVLGGVPYELAKRVRKGKERYTVLDAPPPTPAPRPSSRPAWLSTSRW